MCGFAGIFGKSHSSEMLKSMGAAIRYRGPDDYGVWQDEKENIGLSHRRLAILDLSEAGHQPMYSRSGQYVIAFNGEIYNHLDLRDELEMSSWRGHSDTETLLAGFDEWGIKKTLESAVGMFALAVWDVENKVLTLARDRVGEKPLYYGWQGEPENSAFLFGSELKALKAHPDFSSKIDRNALALFLRHNYIPAPYTIYEEIYKLEPGCYIELSQKEPVPHKTVYWSAAAIVEQGVASALNDTSTALDRLDVLLKNVVRQQMLADVPLGAFLSGGVDSSTIVSLMQEQSSRPVKTFTIGFNEESFNEAEHAKAVAKYLGTEHTELYISPDEALSVIPGIPSLYDEPFADSSQIPTFLVSKLAREHVTVSLSGDAGDELFCGYNRYILTQQSWNKLSRLPRALRRAAAHTITSVSSQAWNNISGPFNAVLPSSIKQANIGDKLHKAAGVLDASSLDDLYLGLVSLWQDPASVVLQSEEPATLQNGLCPKLSGLDNVQRMMALDLMTYLPDDILVKVDRAAMCVSLETRVPLLDHRVIEYAWQLPQSMKLRDGQSKWALRQILYRYVPKKLIERPKVGFGIPLQDWLRGPLRDWAESLLSPCKLKQEGYFRVEIIQDKWQEHLSGKRNWSYLLWGVLMFQAWLDEQGVKSE